MIVMAESTKPEIRLDISDKFYDRLDALINELFEEYNISYGEIELAFLKMDEKILQQKISLMHLYLHSEDKRPTENKKEPSGVYG